MSTIGIKSKIKSLETRIKELQNIYKDDVRESYREATQTQELIHQYQSQIDALKEQLKIQPKSQTVLLKDIKNGKEREFKVVEKNPNPTLGHITGNSPLGKKLLASKKGDKFQIGDNSFEVR